MPKTPDPTQDTYLAKKKKRADDLAWVRTRTAQAKDMTPDEVKRALRILVLNTPPP